MSSRKCIYTGKDANCEDKVIPKNGGDEVHNWVNSAPCNDKYKKKKARNHPTELEMSINRASKMLELAKLDVRYWEIELDSLRAELAKNPRKAPEKATETLEPVVSKTASKKKEREVKISQKEKEIKEVDFESQLNKKKLEW